MGTRKHRRTSSRQVSAEGHFGWFRITFDARCETNRAPCAKVAEQRATVAAGASMSSLIGPVSPRVRYIAFPKLDVTPRTAPAHGE